MSQPPSAFWSVSASELLQHLQATPQGLTSQDAQHRLVRARANLLKPAKRTDTLTLLLAQFKSPIILILLFAAGLSFFLHDQADALIIMVIVLVSGLLSFWQERGAADAVEKLLVIRSRRPFFKSQPGKYLLLATLLSAGVTLVFPFTPLAGIFGFQPLPVVILVVLGVIVGLYILAAEVTKEIFYKSGLGR